MKGKAGATATKTTKTTKSDSERAKLGARGKLGEVGHELKGTKGKMKTAEPRIKSIEESGIATRSLRTRCKT